MIIGGSNSSTSDTSAEAAVAELEDLNASLDDVNTVLGAEGTSPPAISGNGITGYVRSIYDKLVASNASVAAIQTTTATTNAHLAYIEATQDTANGLLGDIKSQGIAVNVNTDTLETLSGTSNANTAGIRTDLATELAKLEQIRAAIVSTLVVPGSVSVSNFPATQPVSAASLPLPSGAATSANQATSATGITQLHTDNGSEGSAPPALNGVGAAGVLGYLRTQLDKLQTIATQLASSIAVTQSGSWQVSGTSGSSATDSWADGSSRLPVISQNMGYNGTSWERRRSNTLAITLDGFIARTVSANGTSGTNYNGNGAAFSINVTAVSGTLPVLVVRVQFSPNNTDWYDLDTTNAQTANITGISTNTLVVYPGIPSVVNRSCNGVLPRFVRMAWTISGTTPSFTFSTSAGYIV